MTSNQLQDVLKCSAGTVFVITGLRLYSEITDFSNWLAENFQSISYVQDCFETLRGSFKSYQERKIIPLNQIRETIANQATISNLNPVSVKDSKTYLKQRGLDSLVLGGFQTIQRMQKGIK